MTDGPKARARRRLARLAWLLDDSIRIPVIGWRIGLDGIIGLVPGIGDAVGAVLSGYIVLSGLRHGATVPTVLRMAANVVIEIVVGAIPIVGDLFDMGFKANQRNLRLMEAQLDDAEGTARRSLLLVSAVTLLLVAVFVGLVILLLWLAFAAFHAFAGAAGLTPGP